MCPHTGRCMVVVGILLKPLYNQLIASTGTSSTHCFLSTLSAFHFSFSAFKPYTQREIKREEMINSEYIDTLALHYKLFSFKLIVCIIQPGRKIPIEGILRGIISMRSFGHTLFLIRSRYFRGASYTQYCFLLSRD